MGDSANNKTTAASHTVDCAFIRFAISNTAPHISLRKAYTFVHYYDH